MAAWRAPQRSPDTESAAEDPLPPVHWTPPHTPEDVLNVEAEEAVGFPERPSPPRSPRPEARNEERPAEQVPVFERIPIPEAPSPPPGQSRALLKSQLKSCKNHARGFFNF